MTKIRLFEFDVKIKVNLKYVYNNFYFKEII